MAEKEKPVSATVQFGFKGNPKDAARTQLSAHEKVMLYVVTLVVVALLYISPSIFAFAKDVIAAMAKIPPAGWKALFYLFIVSDVAVVIIACYAIWSIFSIPKAAIKKGE